MRMNIFSCLFVFVLGCNVTAEISHQVSEEKKVVSLHCPQSVEGVVTWSRERNGQKVDLLTADGYGEKRYNDPGKRFGSSVDKSLHIHRVNLSDTGRYFCNDEPAVDLTVIPSGTMAPTPPPPPPPPPPTPTPTATTATATATPTRRQTAATSKTTKKPKNKTTPYLWQTVRTVTGILYLIIMTSITVTVWTKAGKKQSGHTVETEYVL